MAGKCEEERYKRRWAGVGDHGFNGQLLDEMRDYVGAPEAVLRKDWCILSGQLERWPERGVALVMVAEARGIALPEAPRQWDEEA